MEVLFTGIGLFLILLGTAVVLWVINYYKWLMKSGDSYVRMEEIFYASRKVDEEGNFLFKDFEDYLNSLNEEEG